MVIEDVMPHMGASGRVVTAFEGAAILAPRRFEFADVSAEGWR